MNKTILIGLVIVLISMVEVAGQTVRTPERGSAERAAILNALRAPVERELKQKVIFNLDHFRVTGNWAFLSGDPQTPSGGQPDYSGTPYQEAKDADMFDNNFFALLNKRAGKWRVVTYAIGCTDVCYLDWVDKHKAPKSVYPYSE